MKLIRYQVGEESAYGALVEGTVYSLGGSLWHSPRLGAALASENEVQLLAPCQPSKVIGVGLNYRAHAAEAGYGVPAEPVLFLKPPSSLIGPRAAIEYPERLSTSVGYEAELAVVIGRQARHVRPEAASEYVAGYTCGNDVTARDLQKQDMQWTRAKGFDTFCPLGPWIETDIDVSDLSVRCWVNDILRQDGRTGDMVFSVGELISYVSSVMTLEPGDLILTGTPSGVGLLQPGDRVRVEVEGIGTLENIVVRAEQSAEGG